MIPFLVYGKIMVPIFQLELRELNVHNQHYSLGCGNIMIPVVAILWFHRQLSIKEFQPFVLVPQSID